MSYRGAGTVRGPLHFNGTASPGVSSSGQGRIYFDSGSNSFRVSQNGGSYVDLSVGVPPLSSVLASGSTTSGNNIVISTGDNLALGALALLRSNGQQGGFLLRNGPDNDYGYLEAAGISNYDASSNYLSSFGITNAEVNSDWTINFSSSPTDATLTDTRIGRDGAGFVGFYDASLNYAGIAALVHYIGTDGFVESADATGAPISAANTGRIRYNNTTKTFQQSVDTGAWTDLATTASYPVAPSGGTYTTAAAGSNATAIGDAASAPGSNSFAAGFSASAVGSGSVAIRGSASVAATNGIAILGSVTTTQAIAIGGGGASAASTFGSEVVIGYGATSSGAGSGVAIGITSSVTGASAVAVGNQAAGLAAAAVAVGAVVSVSATGGIGIGSSVTIAAGHNGSIVMGRGASSTAASQFVVGASAPGISVDDVYFGQGVASSAPTAYTIHGTGGSGAAVAGALVRLAAGVSGDAATAGGDVRLGVSLAGSGTTTTDVVYVSSANGGTVGIGAAPGAFKLDVTGGVRVTLTSAPAISVTGQYYSAQFTCTTTLDWNDGNAQAMTLANGNNTFTFTNAAAGGRYLLKLKQPAAGVAGTVTWPVELLWSGGTPPTLTATNDKTDIVTLYYDGTNFFGGYTLNY